MLGVLIAAGLSPFRPSSAEFRGRRIMVRRLKQLFAERCDFAFETTLASGGYVSLWEDMREAGYRIRVDFLWVPDLEITRRRVRSRVVKGGHDIPATCDNGVSGKASGCWQNVTGR